MIALLDTFIFELKGTKDRTSVDFRSLEVDEKYEYIEHKKIDAFSSYQDISKYSKKYKVDGILNLKKVWILDSLSTIAQKKKKVVFVIGTGEVTQVIIKSIKKTKTLFNKDGSFFRQSFSLELQEVLE